mmetsp:Transcript_25690/g.48218  ORF Transcript_25690/g.48218 Transcript_25690/m.48218 type:complete len:105 (-) Transcript_25690:44-358(-)
MHNPESPAIQRYIGQCAMASVNILIGTLDSRQLQAFMPFRLRCTKLIPRNVLLRALADGVDSGGRVCRALGTAVTSSRFSSVCSGAVVAIAENWRALCLAARTF